jgi:hypothetical protein
VVPVLVVLFGRQNVYEKVDMTICKFTMQFQFVVGCFRQHRGKR